MQLKEYQVKCLTQVKEYLAILYEERAKYNRFFKMDSEYDADFPAKTWEKYTGKLNYNSKRNGLKQPLPNFCLKVPTGGGKTLLAAHSIELINKNYLHKRTGFVLWIVPTTQIYDQTLTSLKNREHPYRQVLDISSGGRTLILEKNDKFSPLDVQENLVVMMLMLPSANRQNKETLKIFQDSGGFELFFPVEDDWQANQELLKQFPNLDYFGQAGQVWGQQVKTSLGNTLRLLQPIIIVDEGQKAYSEQAQNTIRGFNPSIMVELSATPPPGANKLVEIRGQELNREQMIKLDINITNKTSTRWQDTLLASVERRNLLQEKAREYENNTGIYIRPICLIQVERTGEQHKNDNNFIHAEHAKDYLIRDCLIDPAEIAIKSSEKDDIEGIDLYSRDCQINYIVTKQALQEGWDCSFAYVLTILTNPKSENSITQLVGRVLRQPFAKKTGIKLLDESYVYCFQQSAGALMRNIKIGLENEGLGDIMGRVVQNSEDNTNYDQEEVGYREQFKKFEGKIYLPHFIMQEDDGWREMRYEMDILSRINWEEINLDTLDSLPLSSTEHKDEVLALGLSRDINRLIEKTASEERQGGLKIDLLFLTRHILEAIPNPWVAYEISDKAIQKLRTRFEDSLIASNMVFIVEELLNIIRAQRDILAEKVFRQLITDRKMCFFLQSGTGFALPKNIRITKSNLLFNTNKGTPLQKSLFEKVDKDSMNDTEQSVAICLDEQAKLLFWYRNMSKVDYYIQGWKQSKIYPDMITTKVDEEMPDDFSKVIVIETKGIHLKNEDTAYKQSIFDICNELGKETEWKELESEFSQESIEFQMIFDNEWKKRVIEVFA